MSCFYDPTTGQFLTRDPANALTRSAYGYVYGNPLNNTDPSGLYCLSGVAGHNANGDEICNGADEVRDNLVPDDTGGPGRWANDHVGIDANVCAIACIGLTYQHGHLYVNKGFGVLAGVGVGPTYYSQPLDPHSDNSNLMWMAGPVGGSVTRDTEKGTVDTDKGWSFGFGKGISGLFLGPGTQESIWDPFGC